MRSKNVSKVILFVFLFVVLFSVLQNILTAKWIFVQGVNDGETQRFKCFYDVPQNTLDYITLGPSPSYYSTNPIEIYCESGWKGYDLGNSCQGIAVSYYWLKEACKVQNPKIVFLDPSALFYDSKTDSEVNVTKALTNMKFSPNKVMACIDCASEKKTAIEYILPMMSFHDRWCELERQDFDYKNEDYFMRGTYLSFYMINYSNIIDKNLYEKDIYGLDGCESNTSYYCNEENENYFSKIVNYCKLNNIELILFIPPSTYKSAGFREKVREIASKYDLNIFDVADYNLVWEWNKDTCDTGRHVNYWGNCKFSNIMSDYLIEKEKKEVGDPFWEKDSLSYQSYEEANLLADQDKVYAFLSTLISNKDDHTILISVKDDACAGWNDVNQYYFSQLGLTGDFSSSHIQQSYIGVVYNGEKLFEQWDAAPMELVTNVNKQKICISSAGFVYGDAAKITIDEVDYAVNSRGLNIVTIDNKTGKVDGSIAIDTHTSQQTILLSKPEYNSMWKQIGDTYQGIKNGRYIISPITTETEALDICAGQEKDKVNCQLWTKTKELPQHFYVEYVGNGLYTIQAVCSGKYLTALDYGNVNCTNVVQDSYTGLANQKWFIYETEENGYTIKNLYNGLVMDVSGTVSLPGVNIQLYECNYGDWQKFSFERIGDV